MVGVRLSAAVPAFLVLFVSLGTCVAVSVEDEEQACCIQQSAEKKESLSYLHTRSCGSKLLSLSRLRLDDFFVESGAGIEYDDQGFVASSNVWIGVI